MIPRITTVGMQQMYFANVRERHGLVNHRRHQRVLDTLCKRRCPARGDFTNGINRSFSTAHSQSEPQVYGRDRCHAT